MAPVRPLYMQAAGGDPALSYSAADYRQFLASLVAQEGVLWGTAVTQRGAGANFSVDVAAGAVAVTGDDVSNQGMYLAINDATYNVTVPSPPGAGTRVHRLVAQIRDKLHAGGTWTTYDWIPRLLEDTGGGTPATPNSAINLARISVAAGQVSVQDAHITDDRVNAFLRPGRLLQVASDAARPKNPVTSEEIFRTDRGAHEFYTGSAWAELLNNRGGSAWTPYTPTWTASTTNPTIGNGTLNGRYMRVGRVIHYVVNLVAGSTTTFGTGNYEIGLPVQVSGSATHIGQAQLAAGTRWGGQVVITTGASSAAAFFPTSATDPRLANWSPTAPVTFANGHSMRISGTYEANI